MWHPILAEYPGDINDIKWDYLSKDKYIEIENANEKYDKQIKDARKNVDRYKEGTKLYEKAQAQYNRNSMTIEENRNDDLSKIRDKKARVKAEPALGPSLLVAPSGVCICNPSG